ncbi:hypothetical protein QT970_23210, partial [Microcoleus sp. herbarium8]|uniref:hypothetical protein n=1 Tax=Microcoleus sp. herbarium8 TaxID=3055436 RepID=UPI002FCFDE98
LIRGGLGWGKKLYDSCKDCYNNQNISQQNGRQRTKNHKKCCSCFVSASASNSAVSVSANWAQHRQ